MQDILNWISENPLVSLIILSIVSESVVRIVQFRSRVCSYCGKPYRLFKKFKMPHR